MKRLILLTSLLFSLSSQAQKTLTFEQPSGTTLWTENSLNWQIIGGTDYIASGSTAKTGTGYYAAKTATSSKLTFDSLLNISSVWMLMDMNNSVYAPYAELKAYDINGNLKHSQSLGFENTYQLYSLNWIDVKSIGFYVSDGTIFQDDGNGNSVETSIDIFALFDEMTYTVSSTASCYDTFSSIDTTVNSFPYIAPDGSYYYQAGAYSATINNAAGCDSVITINVLLPTIDQPNIVDFEQANNTTSWTEDGLTWQFVGGSDQTQLNLYNAFSGSGYGRTSSGSNSKLTFQQPLSLQSVKVKYYGGMMWMNATLYGYDSLDNVIAQSAIQPNGNYETLNLNWDNISSISFDVPWDEFYDPMDTTGTGPVPYPQDLYFDEFAYSSIPCQTSYDTLNQIVSAWPYYAPDGSSHYQADTFTVALINNLGCDSLLTINLSTSFIDQPFLVEFDQQDGSTSWYEDGKNWNITGINTVVRSDSNAFEGSGFLEAKSGYYSSLQFETPINLISLQGYFDDNNSDWGTWAEITGYDQNDGYLGYLSFEPTEDYSLRTINWTNVKYLKFVVNSSYQVQYDSLGNYVGNTTSDAYLRIDNISYQNPCIADTSYTSETAIGIYTAPDGQVYSQTGIYYATVTTSDLCDSTIVIDLSISVLDQPNIVDFEQANNTTSWTEDGLTWQFVGGSDQTQLNLYNAFSGSGFGRSSSGSNSKFTFEEPLSLQSIRIKYFGGMLFMPATLNVYDSLNTIITSISINPNGNYQLLTINQNNVSSISFDVPMDEMMDPMDPAIMVSMPQDLYFDELAYSVENTPPVCQIPTIGMPVDLARTDSSATLWWSGLDATTESLNLQYRETGAATWNTISIPNTTQYDIFSLNALTTYEVQVEAVCAGNINSGYSAIESFTTLETVCQNTYATIDTTVNSFPYIAPDGSYYYQAGAYSATINNAAGCDSVITINVLLPTIDQPNIVDFEQANNTTSWTEDGLTWQFVGGSDQTQLNLYNAFSGSGYGRTSSGSNSKLTFQQPLSLQSVKVKYYGGMMWMNATLYTYDSLNNVISTISIPPNSNYQLLSINQNNVSSISFDIPMDEFYDPEIGPMPMPQDLYFDELAYSQTLQPICNIPTQTQYSNATSTSIQPYWLWENGKKYLVRHQDVNDGVWVYSDTLVSNYDGIKTYTITGLLDSQTYQWQVKAICNDTLSSEFSEPFTWTTFCQPPQFSSTAVVSITDSSGLVNWEHFGIPMDFKLLFRANGQVNWDTVLVDTTEVLLSGLNPATEYEIKIGSICTETVSSNFSNSSYFTTLTPACIDSYAIIDTTVQNLYLSPSGQSYTLSGTYTDIIENTAGCDSVITVNLTVVLLPLAPEIVLSNSNICSGDSIQVSASCSTGTLVWINNFTGSSTTFIPSNDTLIKAYCIENNLSSDTTVAIVSVYDRPYIFTDTTNLCSTASITLHARGISNLIELQWYKDGILIEGATDSLLTVITEGNYSVATMIQGNESEWLWLNPKLPINEIYDSYFVNQKGWSVGSGGLIQKTIDSGESWQKLPTPIIGTFKAVYFLNEDIGWVVGYPNIILKTIDGGNSWIQQSSGLSNNFIEFRGVSFSSNNEGIIIGTSGTIIKTIDGGISWQSISSSTFESFNDVQMLNNQLGFIAGDKDFLLKTVDGGATWANTANISGVNTWNNFKDIVFKDALNGWAVGESRIQYSFDPMFPPMEDSRPDVIYRTIDGGSTWVLSSFNNIYNANLSVSFANYNIGWLSNESGSIFKTINGGQSWVLQITTGDKLNSVTAVNDSLVYAFGVNGNSLKSSDGGNSWLNSQSTVTSSSFKKVDFTSKQKGWAIAGTQIFYTDNGGKTWSLQFTGDFWNDIQMLNDTIGYVASSYGQVAKTINGGQNWTYTPTNTGSYLFDIHFSDTQNGWAVGENGTVIHTIDAGQSWSPVNTPITGTYTSSGGVYFMNADTGYISGYGFIMKTDDGGLNWTTTNGLTAYASKMQFTSENIGYLMGNEMMKTSNGGQSWSNLSDYSIDFYFLNDTLGWKAGIQGSVLKTTNGGLTWQSMNAPTSNHINSIDFIGEIEGWAVGNGGQILKFQPKREVACLSEIITIGKTLTAPQITSTPQTICSGEVVTLFASGCESGNIKWNDGQSGSSITVQPQFTTTFKAVCQKFSCDSDSSNGVLITVNQIPTAPVFSLGDTTICQGSSLSISTAGCLNGNLEWSNSFIGKQQTISPLQNMTLSAWCESNNGCQSTVTTINITVYDKPYIYADTTNLCADSTLTLHARGVSELTKLQWFKDGLILDGQTDSLLTVTSSGNYTVASMKNGLTASWNWQNPNFSQNISITSNQLRDVDFVTESKGWAIGATQIFNTVDGGKNWNIQFTGDYWNKIQMLNDLVGYAASGSGTIAKTTNGGINWNYTPTGVTNYFYSMHFSDINHGWAVGDYGIIIKTVDGGQSWQSMTSPLSGSYYSYEGVYFTSPDTGYVGVSGFNYGLKTTDGGLTWTYQYDFPANTSKFQFTSNQVGYLMGNDMRKSTDGGNTWAYIGEYAIDFHFVNDSVGFKSNINGIVQKTTNGGATWTPWNTPSGEHMWAIDFLEENLGWAVGGDGNILNYSPDLITACESNPLEITQSISAPQITSTPQAICSGEVVTLFASGCESGNIKWNDGQSGSSITVQPQFTTTFKAVCQKFSCDSDSSNGVLITVNQIPTAPVFSLGDTTICQGSSLSISTAGCLNGNLEWSNSFIGNQQTISPLQNMTLSAWCESNNGCQSTVTTINITVYEKPYIYTESTDLCADSSIVLHARGISSSTQLQWYRDGAKIDGATDSLYTVTIEGNYSVASMKGNTSNEWVWQNPNSNNVSITSAQMRDVDFVNESKGWAIGGNNIYHTSNGGKAWQLQFTGDYWNKIQMLNDTIGYVASGSGNVLKTINGGQSWSYTPTGVTSYLYSMHFPDRLNGWAVGDRGTIIKTIDGGETWLNISSPISGTYTAGEGVYFTSPDSGFVGISGYGYMLRTTDGGQNWTMQYNVPAYTGKFQFTSSKIGYLMGNDMRKTTDGGDTWNFIGDYAIDFHFINDSVGFKSYINGIVQKTVDGGLSWSSMDTPSGEHIWAIDFLNESLGWTVGGNGNILKLQPTLTQVCLSQSIDISKKVTAPIIIISDTTICGGSSVILQATGCSSGVIHWNDGQTGAEITVSPFMTTTYTTYCQQNSCSSDLSNGTKVTVLPSPSPPILSANSAIILTGESSTLSATNCAGTVVWSDGLGSGISKIVYPVFSKSYFANCVVDGCESNNISIEIIVSGSNPCPDSLIHSGIVSSANYQVLSVLKSNGNVENETVYQAGKSITLLPGFSAGSNELFRAEIKDCDACSISPPTPTVILKNISILGNVTYINLTISNRGLFQSEMFLPASYLPPCGLNTNSSRTWVEIYDSQTNQYINGFCGLQSPNDLDNIWVAGLTGNIPFSSVYVKIIDRLCGKEYISNSLTVN